MNLRQYLILDYDITYKHRTFPMIKQYLTQLQVWSVCIVSK